MSFNFCCSKLATIDAHQGTCHDFVRRYETTVAAAAGRDSLSLNEFHLHIVERIADPRNLRVAWDRLARKGGETPGPNGIRFADVEESDIWPILRAMSKRILAGQYRTGGTRIVKLPKSIGTGFRRISLLDIQDRVVHRAIVQILQPLVDPFFDEYSFGGRPRRNCWQALQCAVRIVQHSGNSIWIVDDIRAAFDNVPLERAMDVIRKWFPDNQALWQLMSQTIQHKGHKGLLQGSPASPLLMNMYLDHFLDQKWRKQYAAVPLLRYLDDIVVICPAGHNADKLYSWLRQLLRDAGFALKGDQLKSIRYLASGQTATWLGFELSLVNRRLMARLPAESSAPWYQRFRGALSDCHRHPNAPLRAQDMICGTLKYFGPCFAHSDRKGIYRLIASAAKEFAFEEIPLRAVFMAQWKASFRRYQRLDAITVSPQRLFGAAQ